MLEKKQKACMWRYIIVKRQQIAQHLIKYSQSYYHREAKKETKLVTTRQLTNTQKYYVIKRTSIRQNHHYLVLSLVSLQTKTKKLTKEPKKQTRGRTSQLRLRIFQTVEYEWFNSIVDFVVFGQGKQLCMLIKQYYGCGSHDLKVESNEFSCRLKTWLMIR